MANSSTIYPSYNHQSYGNNDNSYSSASFNLFPWIVLCPTILNVIDGDEQKQINVVSRTESATIGLQNSFNNNNVAMDAFADQQTIHNIAVLQKLIQESKGCPWQEKYEYVLGIVVGLANNQIIMTRDNFVDTFKTIPGVPAWGRVSNHVWCRMLGGINPEWVAMQPKFLVPHQYHIIMLQDDMTLNPWWKYWKAACSGLNFTFHNPMMMQNALALKSKHPKKIKYSNESSKKRQFLFLGNDTTTSSSLPPFKKIKLSANNIPSSYIPSSLYTPYSSHTISNMTNKNTSLYTPYSSHTISNMTNTNMTNKNTSLYTPYSSHTISNMTNTNMTNKNTSLYPSNNSSSTHLNHQHLISQAQNKAMKSEKVMFNVITNNTDSIIDKINSKISSEKVMKQLKPKNKMRRKSRKTATNNDKGNKMKSNPIDELKNMLKIVNEKGVESLQILNQKQGITSIVSLMLNINDNDTTNENKLPMTIQNIKLVCNSILGLDKDKIFMSKPHTFNQFMLPKKSNVYCQNDQLTEAQKVTNIVKEILTNSSVIEHVIKSMKEVKSITPKKKKKKRKVKKKKIKIIKEEVCETDEDDDIQIEINKNDTLGIGKSFANLNIQDKKSMLSSLSQEDKELILRLLQE